MKAVTNVRGARALGLVLIVAAVASIAACSNADDMTGPRPAAKSFRSADIVDTTGVTCRSGYTLVNGAWECAGG